MPISVAGPAIIFPYIQSDASNPSTYGAIGGFINPGTGRHHLCYPYIDSGREYKSDPSNPATGFLGDGRLKWRINESCDDDGIVIGHATLRSTGVEEPQAVLSGRMDWECKRLPPGAQHNPLVAGGACSCVPMREYARVTGLGWGGTIAYQRFRWDGLWPETTGECIYDFSILNNTWYTKLPCPFPGGAREAGDRIILCDLGVSLGRPADVDHWTQHFDWCTKQVGGDGEGCWGAPCPPPWGFDGENRTWIDIFSYVPRGVITSLDDNRDARIWAARIRPAIPYFLGVELESQLLSCPLGTAPYDEITIAHNVKPNFPGGPNYALKCPDDVLFPPGSLHPENTEVAFTCDGLQQGMFKIDWPELRGGPIQIETYNPRGSRIFCNREFTDWPVGS